MPFQLQINNLSFVFTECMNFILSSFLLKAVIRNTWWTTHVFYICQAEHWKEKFYTVWKIQMICPTIWKLFLFKLDVCFNGTLEQLLLVMSHYTIVSKRRKNLFILGRSGIVKVWGDSVSSPSPFSWYDTILVFRLVWNNMAKLCFYVSLRTRMSSYPFTEYVHCLSVLHNLSLK